LERKANLQHNTAFHLLTVTFPLVKDPKLLMGIINNIFLSIEATIDIILKCEKELELIPAYPNEFKNKFNLFKSKSAKRHHILTNHLEVLGEIHTILELHKKSPVEFRRKDRFIICNKDYKMYEITVKEIKNYLETNKIFLQSANKVIYRK